MVMVAVVSAMEIVPKQMENAVVREGDKAVVQLQAQSAALAV
jgi:hypothetical protein